MPDQALTLFPNPRKPGRPRKVVQARAFLEAVAAAEHLRMPDSAVREAGLRLAHAIDSCEDDKTLAALMGQYLGILDRLGLHPKGRRHLEIERPNQEVNPFDAVRHLFESEQPDADQDADAQLEV